MSRPGKGWLRDRVRRRSLRRRLVTGVLVLVTVGLLVADVAAALLLRSYLGDQADEQLDTVQGLLTQAEQRMGWLPSALEQTQDRAPESALDAQLQGMLNDFVIEYRDVDGELALRSSSALRSSNPPDLPPLRLEDARALAGRPFTADSQDGGGRDPGYRVLVRAPEGGRGSVIVAYDMTSSRNTLARLVAIEVAVTLLVLGLVALLGVGVVRVGLRPLDDVERTAQTIISAGDLSRRVPEGTGPDTEIGRLSATFNRMLGQIQQAFGQRAASEARLRRFAADASHELRTPLAGIRGLAELHRQGAVRDPARSPA
jgi:two-component system OmpR family sensor kinase